MDITLAQLLIYTIIICIIFAYRTPIGNYIKNKYKMITTKSKVIEKPPPLPDNDSKSDVIENYTEKIPVDSKELPSWATSHNVRLQDIYGKNLIGGSRSRSILGEIQFTQNPTDPTIIPGRKFGEEIDLATLKSAQIGQKYLGVSTPITGQNSQAIMWRDAIARQGGL